MTTSPRPGLTPADRDRIALALLKRAREGSENVAAVWYGGGMGIRIKRRATDLDPEAISWREAHRLAFPEDYATKEVPRKPNARFQGGKEARKLAV